MDILYVWWMFSDSVDVAGMNDYCILYINAMFFIDLNKAILINVPVSDLCTVSQLAHLSRIGLNLTNCQFHSPSSCAWGMGVYSVIIKFTFYMQSLINSGVKQAIWARQVLVLMFCSRSMKHITKWNVHAHTHCTFCQEMSSNCHYTCT